MSTLDTLAILFLIGIFAAVFLVGDK